MKHRSGIIHISILFLCMACVLASAKAQVPGGPQLKVNPLQALRDFEPAADE